MTKAGSEQELSLLGWYSKSFRIEKSTENVENIRSIYERLNEHSIKSIHESLEEIRCMKKHILFFDI